MRYGKYSAWPWQNTIFIPPAQRSCWGGGGGGTGFTPSVRPSVCPSVRPSRIPCPLCNSYSSGWILSILGTNDHYHERVCRAPWPLTLTYIFKVIRPWLRNRVRSVASTDLNGFFWYMTQWSLLSEGVSRGTFFFRIWEIRIFGKFLKFFGFDLKKKIYSSWWILSIFCTNVH